VEHQKSHWLPLASFLLPLASANADHQQSHWLRAAFSSQPE
jgi:hypothetical protein